MFDAESRTNVESYFLGGEQDGLLDALLHEASLIGTAEEAARFLAYMEAQFREVKRQIIGSLDATLIDGRPGVVE
jgi:hypothetical protein